MRSASRLELGASALEYAGLILLVTLLLVTLASVSSRVQPLIEHGLCVMFQEDDCKAEAGEDEEPPGQRGGPGEPPEGPSKGPGGRKTPPAHESRDDLRYAHRADPADVDRDSKWPSSKETLPAKNEKADSENDGPIKVPDKENPLHKPNEHFDAKNKRKGDKDYESEGTSEEVDRNVCDHRVRTACDPDDVKSTRSNVRGTINATRTFCALGMEKYCLPQSAENLEHFLDGGGKKKKLDMEKFMKDVPEFKDAVEKDQRNLGEMRLPMPRIKM